MKWNTPMLSNPTLHLAQAIAAAFAVLIGDTAVSLGNDWLTAIERIGLVAVLVLFFVATSWVREGRMAKRIDKLEGDVVKLTNKLAAQTESTSRLVREESELMHQAISTLALRPCFAFESRDEFDNWVQWKQSKKG